MHRLRARLLGTLAFATPFGVSAQDVEMLGRRYGATPPPAYFEELRRNPTAFRFSRGRAARIALRAPGPPGGDGPAAALGPRDGPLVGDYYLPVVMGLFADSPAFPPFSRDVVQSAYFGSQPGTVSDYYAEVSGGRLDLLGESRDWVRSTLSQDSVTNGNSGLAQSRIGAFIHELLALQVGADWGRYDNDGPDGVPNSGDDDGFVDALAVIHPTEGAECAGPGQADRIWAHKWSLSSAAGAFFVTDVPSNAPGGGFVRVDDYFVQGVLSCSSAPGTEVLNEIGVFTHETGHAFGLPDLYDTCPGSGACGDDSFRHAGAGVWGLMAAGSWGCDNGSPESPCHMSAWSKEQLGWVDVVTLSPDTDHGTISIPPVETSGSVYRVDAGDGSGEYFLLENRQRIGYDVNLRSPGLLVWQIHPDSVLARWRFNTVNGFAHMGVHLQQADGLNDLGRAGGGRGDASDPFPGATANDRFHAGSTPASISFPGTATGVTLLDITENGPEIDVRVSTRFTAVTLDATGPTSTDGLFMVDGSPLAPGSGGFSSAPFLVRSVEAAEAASPAPGERRRFQEWSDDTAAGRDRSLTTPMVDTTLTAAYGGVEYELALSTTGGVGPVEPATFLLAPTTPDGWYVADTEVTVEALPLTGFDFLGWFGDLSGQPNPATVTMSGPVTAGADLELVFEVTGVGAEITATVDQDIQLVAENGAAPYSWRVTSGSLPVGLALTGTGRITGAAIDLGVFTFEVEALDSNGLPARGTVTLDIGEPDLPIEVLTSPFLLSGPLPTAAQVNFLNHQGNGVSGYDLGDFRAWVLAHPSLPMAETVRDGPRTLIVPLTPTHREERR